MISLTYLELLFPPSGPLSGLPSIWK
uniref:Uncharacterized protein n=1 Tax=Arundo donax TaxID=35708 RepID=A0A0A8Y0F3_ARUDO